ncbi:MAG: glycosyltransferase family 39 protein, partial [Aggregatilineales bacterium]
MFLTISRRFQAFAVTLLALLTLLTYVRGVPNLFVAEDFNQIMIGRFTLPQLLDHSMAATRLRPFFYVFQWIVTQLLDLNAVGYHLVILGLHIATVLTLYALAREIGGREIGLVAAALFAVYPRHHQPVLWYAFYAIVLTTLLTLLTALAYLRWRRTGRRAWYGAALAAAALALLTQEAAMLIPVLIAVAELARLAHERNLRALHRPRFYLALLPFAVLVSGFLALNFTGARAFKLTGGASLSDLAVMGMRSGEAYHTTLGLDTLKDALAYLTYWALPVIPLRALDPSALTAALALAVCAGLLAAVIWGSWLARVGVLWGGIALVPFIVSVPFGNADRYFYLASAGWALTVAALLLWLGEAVGKRRSSARRLTVAVGTAAYLLVFAGLIQARIDEWQAAGALAARIAQEVDTLLMDAAPGDTVVLAGLPMTYGQAYVFSIGASPAVRLHRGHWPQGAKIYQTQHPDVIN